VFIYEQSIQATAGPGAVDPVSVEAVLTVGHLPWTLITLAIYVAYRADSYARSSGWRRLAEERHKQQAAWRLLDRCGADRRHHDTMVELDEYLRDDSRLYDNPEDD
jgi:hypothetical protein